MMKLSFLNNVVVVGEKKVASAAVNNRKPSEVADLRVYHTGACYPSAAFVDKFNLSYQKDKAGNGLDIFQASKFGGIETKPENDFIFIAAVPRKGGKIDLFGSAEVDEKGEPKADVLIQGPSTFGKKTLIPLLAAVYGVTLDKDSKPFIDLKVVGGGESYNQPWENSNGVSVYMVPKVISRGDALGQLTTKRRENLLLWALVPMEMVGEEGTAIILDGPAYKEVDPATLTDESGEDGPDNGDELFDGADSTEAFNPGASNGTVIVDGPEELVEA